MRKRLFTTVALAGLLAAAWGVTTNGATARGCSVSGAETISQTETARVLATRPHTSGGLEVRTVYACAFNSGELVKLGRDRAFQDEGGGPAQQRLEAIALDELPGAAGDAVAFSVQRCPEDTTDDAACTADVRVRSLSSGKQVAYAAAGSRVWTIVVRAPYEAAFISERSDGTVEVHRLLRQDDRVVDTGTGQQIDVGSLAAPEGWRNVSGGDGLPGLDFFWQTDAGPRSASMKCGSHGPG